MVELNELMRDCLIEANNEYPDHDYVETVFEAFKKYVAITGGPVEIEGDEEGEQLMMECMTFLIDCLIFNLIEKGVVEFEGIEDGEMVYKATVEF